MGDVKSFYKAIKEGGNVLSVAELVELALGMISPSARCLILAFIELHRENMGRVTHFLRRAEVKAKDQRELAAIKHVESVILLTSGDSLAAVQREKESLDLCGGDDAWLRGEAMSHLSYLYRVLGHDSLAAAYADEAAKIMPD